MRVLLSQQGKQSQAEPLLREAFQAVRALGPKDLQYVYGAHNLGALLQEQGKHGEAEPLLREALAGCDSVLGRAHPRTRACLTGLLGTLVAGGKVREARDVVAQFGPL